jgi:Fe-S cluster assembly protein SufD
MSTATIGADAARAIARAGNEPDWLERWRLQAWDSYEGAPLPDRVVHLWRYSEPEKFLIDKVNPLLPDGSEGQAVDRAAAMSLSDKFSSGSTQNLAGLLIQQDGQAPAFALEDEWRDAGVILCDLSTAVQQHPEIIEKHLGGQVPIEESKFTALNAALFSGGVFLYVPAGVEIGTPVHALYQSGQDLAAVFPRTLIVLEEGASAIVIDEYGSAPDASTNRASGAGSNGAAPRVIAHAVTEASVGKNAKLQYVNVQNWGSRTRSHYTQKIHLGRDAQAVSVGIGLGGLYNKTDVRTELRGANAYSEMIGVLFGDASQHFDNHTEHIHVHGHTYSDLDFKVVLENSARSAYTGLIRIDVDAADSEAYQENRNLLLDEECRAESIPELEILNENVRCTHGATIGPIDEEQVFYLMTRGLSLRDAERIIVEGFFAPVLDRIDDKAMHARLWDYVRSKLQTR